MRGERRKYDTPEHRMARKVWRQQIDAGGGWCAEYICLMESRYIEPGARFDVAHDPSGIEIIGASHPRCNRSEAASRGNRQRGWERHQDRWVL